jgi:hypothetical protein
MSWLSIRFNKGVASFIQDLAIRAEKRNVFFFRDAA